MSKTDTDGPDIPEQAWTNPFPDESPMGQLYNSRVKNDMDLIIIVSDYHNRRGTGKTILSLELAAAMDRTSEGLTKEKVTLSPEELREAYAEQPKGSGLVLDEAEVGIGNRSAMTNVNKALREIMSMGRVEEKYLVLNAPNNDHIDKSVKELGDVWMLVQKRGDAIVHFLEYQPYAGKAMTPKKELFSWRDLPSDSDLQPLYRYLTTEKRKKIAGDDGSGFISRDEHEEQLSKAVQSAKQEQRDALLRSLWEEAGESVTQKELAGAVDLSTRRVQQILKE